jgi:hypothetical protein
MIGIPVDDKLAFACEQRLGRVVHVASTFHLRRIASPVGSFNPRKPLRVVVALSEDDLWLLEFGYWVVGFEVGVALCRFPRSGLVSQWRHRSWAWPAVWKVELSWPDLATYVAGSMIGRDDANRLMGLLVADELDRASTTAAAADEGRFA